MAKTSGTSASAGAGLVLLTLATGQFLMMLDSSVMNVSIATVAEDVGTTVSGIQAAITLYMLVMATMMITGGKIGTMIGRRRAFSIGCVVYGAGSLTTALAPNVTVLYLGWSVLEGLGAALIMPAIVALVATNFPAEERPRAYGLIAASAAIAVAAGPLIGGFATTYFSWRYVFAGEVVLVFAILLLARRIHDAPAEGYTDFDFLGNVLWVLGLGLGVFGVLQSGSWGWVSPKPDAPGLLGVSAVTWLMIASLIILWAFVLWENRRVAHEREPLIRLKMLDNLQLEGGLTMFFFQFLVQAGIFFIVPLFLSVSLGLSAFETGVRLLPISIAILVAAVGVPKMFPAASPRRVVQFGLASLAAGLIVLIGALEAGVGPEVVTLPLILAGLGVGALASQLGAVTVSSMPDEMSGEVGGLQNTVSNLGAALGTALAGSVLIAVLGASFISGVQQNPAVPPSVVAEAQVQLTGGAEFISDAQLETALEEADVTPETAEAIVDENAEARIDALRVSLLVLTLFALAALFFTRRLPAAPVGAPAGTAAGAGPEPAPVAPGERRVEPA
ncbi:MAG: MFS transporter [Thermoleophilia bacterium]